MSTQLHYKIKHCRGRRGNAFDDLGQHVILPLVSRSRLVVALACHNSTFSSLVKTGSREPAITGEKRKKGAFELREKTSGQVEWYKNLSNNDWARRLVNSSKGQWLARLCNKGKFGGPSGGRGSFAGVWSMVADCSSGGIKRVCEKAPGRS